MAGMGAFSYNCLNNGKGSLLLLVYSSVTAPCCPCIHSDIQITLQVSPEPVKNPRIVAVSLDALALLDIDPEEVSFFPSAFWKPAFTFPSVSP